jgi:hypothetical protein
VISSSKDEWPKCRESDMPRISFNATRFPAESGIHDGESDLVLSWDELIWAAISVGRGSLAHMHQHGPFSMFEMIYREAIVYANLMETDDGHITRTSAYEGLDPSEKSAISYFVGLAVTKLFVASKLNVPWLMHVDIYRQQFGLELVPYGGRPDLFGQDLSGRWIVAESKGRTNGHDSSALDRAKTQAALVTTVDGVAPFISAGFVTSFSKGRLYLVADDPPPDRNGKPLFWKVSGEQLRSAYYAPFLALFERYPSQIVRRRGRQLRTVRSEAADLIVGVVEEVVGGVNVTQEHATPNAEEIERGFLGIDGVFVELGPSWNDELMHLEPQLRG